MDQLIAHLKQLPQGRNHLIAFPENATDTKGNVFVADSGAGTEETNEIDHDNNRVEKFTNDGRFITSFGTYGIGNGQFDVPFGIAVDPSGNVFVSDHYNSRVQMFAPCHGREQSCEHAGNSAP